MNGNQPTDKAVVAKKNMTTSEAAGGDFSDKNFGFGQRRPIDEKGFKQFLEQVQAKRSQHATSIRDYPFDERRSRCINGVELEHKEKYRGVSFWMFRDQRVDDNWALIWAQKIALQHKCPLYVTFFLMSHYSVAGRRQYEFMLKGLQQVEQQCKSLGIQFHLELGYAKDKIDAYCEEHEIDFVVADMCPLRDPMRWVKKAGNLLRKKLIPLYQVDAHNIVPVWIMSNRLEQGAWAMRRLVAEKLSKWLTELPAIERHPHQPKCVAGAVDWQAARAHLKIDETVRPVAWARPGTVNGYRMLYEFITQRLEAYTEVRNDANRMACSYLSPYYHFGQLSTQRAILEISAKPLKERHGKSVDHYVEESVVRRELADNFCFYNYNYDNLEGAPDWARRTLEDHRSDKRERLYSQEELQFAKTHDKLWNATQIQMLQEGSMHAYMRQYWAKKIFEWSPSVEEALRVAMLLNDKYELDGRDPNGYTGIMAQMCGVHDRTFAERPIWGKIRVHTARGCAKWFDVNQYANTYKSIN